ncbi:MAG: DMT family transporter [bacterium]
MKIKGFPLILSATIISGFSVFINGYAITNINPVLFTCLKNISVGLAILLIIFAFKKTKLTFTESKSEYIKLLIISVIGGSIPFILFFKGLALTNASNGAFIQKTMFVISAILAIKFLKEKINWNYYLAGILILIGNVIALKFLPPLVFGWGDLMILGATILWAFENTLSKYVLKNISANTVILFRMFGGGLIILAYSFISGDFFAISKLNGTGIFWIFITSFILLTYVMTWYSGLKTVKLSTASIILVLASPITTLLSFIVTQKIPSINMNIGNLLIILGIVVLFYAKYRKEKVPNIIEQ